jgi:hypothetical protein
LSTHRQREQAVRLKLSRTSFIDSKVFAMSSSPIRYAALLRRELSERNASYATLHQLAHVTSYGEMPVVIYQPSPCGTRHGNFIPASYRALQHRPQWKQRFEKVHSQAGRAFPQSDCVSKELDSSMSSDALLMNIFCYPGVTKRRELSLMLGTETGDLPEFGFKPRISLTSGFVERTEIDMKLGSVLFEASVRVRGTWNVFVRSRITRPIHRDVAGTHVDGGTSNIPEHFVGFSTLVGIFECHSLIDLHPK